MATYNGAEFIAASLDSVLGQTSPAEEVIVVDDGSTDDTAALVDAYSDSVTVIHQHNQGAPAAFNRAIAAARGDYVALAADDDIWEAQKLELQREILAGDPDVDILVGHMVVFGWVTGEFRRPPGRGRLDRDTLRRAQFEGSCLAAPTALIRRGLFGRVGGFRDDLPAEDYEFWLRALRHGAAFHYDPRPVVRYRQHEGNQSKREWLMHETHYDVLRDYARDIDDRELVRRVLARNRLIVARHRLAAGQREPARRAFGASVRHRPTLKAAMWAVLLHDRLSARAALAGRRMWARRPRRGTQTQANSETAVV